MNAHRAVVAAQLCVASHPACHTEARKNHPKAKSPAFVYTALLKSGNVKDKHKPVNLLNGWWITL
jgi:hypothetical protein